MWLSNHLMSSNNKKTPPPAKRQIITRKTLESIEFPDESELDGEDQEKLESTKFSAILGSGMPIYHANAKIGRVPWTDVEKVYFPLNEPKLHWALAELHIYTGVIILYDSMTLRKRNKDALIVENRKWWLTMRETMSTKLPLFLDNIGVLKRKGLLIGEYKITY
ncbi:phospholipase-like protein [Tanacetum coccineum]